MASPHKTFPKILVWVFHHENLPFFGRENLQETRHAEQLLEKCENVAQVLQQTRVILWPGNNMGRSFWLIFWLLKNQSTLCTTYVQTCSQLFFSFARVFLSHSVVSIPHIAPLRSCVCSFRHASVRQSSTRGAGVKESWSNKGSMRFPRSMLRSSFTRRDLLRIAALQAGWKNWLCLALNSLPNRSEAKGRAQRLENSFHCAHA
jgi:hypothetical protein